MQGARDALDGGINLARSDALDGGSWATTFIASLLHPTSLPPILPRTSLFPPPSPLSPLSYSTAAASRRRVLPLARAPSLAVVVPLVGLHEKVVMQSRAIGGTTIRGAT